MSDSEEIVLSHKTWAKSMEAVEKVIGQFVLTTLTIEKVFGYRITLAIEKDGFREGFEAGRDKNFQIGFDIGYKTGFEHVHEKALQATKKLMNEKTIDKYEPPNDNCVICSMNNEDEMMQLPLEDIIEKQRHSFVQS